ncbi:hypothetical protein QBC47DRAFT_386131 [Echria macrotheca]|uniref:RRM domain-containing protein n=1 Tax=Echria macrotheca TaxID=438768 RepID=A0AAJ0F8E1_9PEZI|nr:hypothetical protein QBC47DRAFT_386131 [Echria macrotheca]
MTAVSGESLSDSAAYTRLHVTPLDAELVKVVLSSSLLAQARNFSYHTIETFPEKRYGFLELPSDDAEKLRRKLNGSVLKGVKIRIERAKPSRVPTPLGEAAMARNKDSEKSKSGDCSDSSKIKKRKRDADIEGVVLEEGRRVKRGWTATDEPNDKDKKARREKKDKKDKKDPKSRKKQPKSKYTDHAECLIKTVLPPNAVESTEGDSSSKRKKGKSREVVIHEFEKTTKFPTFLKASATTGQSKAQLEFVDGKGWVDEEGNIVEAVKSRYKPSKPREPINARAPETRGSDLDETGAENSDTDGSAEEPDQPEKHDGAISAERPKKGSDAPSSDEALQSNTSDPARPKSSGSARNLSIRIPPATPSAPKVHPLEALYKRPAVDGAAAPVDSETKPFSFFGGVDDEEMEDDADEVVTTHIPLTPFTQQDIENRVVRSAAPTPDTAHPSRRFTPWEHDEDDIEEEAEEGLADSPLKGAGNNNSVATVEEPAGQDEAAPTSDFQKWFWENRGEVNRSWRKRRKQAAKEKRYRENRARMSRAI